jgi:hypothetical protein
LVPDYLKNIVRILEYGLNTNSYKFALLRSLAEIGRETPQIDRVPYTSLAEKFLKYYWPLTILFRIRQATDPTRDPIIMKFIRREAEELQLSPYTFLEDYRREYPDRYAEVLSRCSQRGGCFDEVIPRFHIVHRNSVQPAFYTWRDSEVNLSTDSQRFLGEYSSVIEPLAVGSWVRFTEQYTNVPRLYEKIRGVRPERKHGRYRPLLSKLQGAHCFYCGKPSPGSLAVEHVIPWCYVLEDRVWNLVLACNGCNLAKSSQTPGDEHVKQLIERNKKMLAELTGGSEAGLGQFVTRDLREFLDRDIDEHIRTLLVNCRADGFGVWVNTTL